MENQHSDEFQRSRLIKQINDNYKVPQERLNKLSIKQLTHCWVLGPNVLDKSWRDRHICGRTVENDFNE